MNKLSLAFCAALLAAQAHADTVSIANPAAGSPATAGTGLNGQYWDTNSAVSTNAGALSAATGSPAATFLATTVDYTSTHTAGGTSVPDTTSLANFLGGNAANLKVSGSHSLDTSVYLFTGWLNVTAGMDTVPGGPIDIAFQVGSDDGMKLSIGGATVTQYDAPRPYGYSSGTASFASAGLYPIALVFWENYGNTGVDLAWKTGTANTWQDIPTASLYASLPAAASDGHVPEPASLALVGLGMMAAVRGRRRRG